MVYKQDLDLTFNALADPTRRALLARLREQPELSVSNLAAPFAMSLPAVMKHLDVLGDAGLIERSKQGRTVACRLRAAPMREAMEWLNKYERFWAEGLDRLAAFLEQEPWQKDQASPSSATSTRRRNKSSARGSTRKK
jgi:DNA-binding transcriptional ArsR family regulator